MIFVEIDTAVDAGYIRVSDAKVTSTSEFSESIVVDLDEYGRVVGIEVLELGCTLPVGDLTTRYHLTDEAIAVLRSIRPSLASLTAKSEATRSSSAIRRSPTEFHNAVSAV